MIDLELGEKLEKAARPGPWRERCEHVGWSLEALDENGKVTGIPARTMGSSQGTTPEADANAHLLVWLRNNAQALIAAARLVEEIDKLVKFKSDTMSHRIYGMIHALDPTPQTEAATDAPAPASPPARPGPGSTAR